MAGAPTALAKSALGLVANALNSSAGNDDIYLLHSNAGPAGGGKHHADEAPVARGVQRRPPRPGPLLERRLMHKNKKLCLSMAVKKQITVYQKYVDENIMLTSVFEVIFENYEEAKEESELLKQDREALMEFGNEAEELAREAETRADQAEERSGKIMEEFDFLKKGCEVLKEKEGKMLEELGSLSKMYDELNCKGVEIFCKVNDLRLGSRLSNE